MGYVEQNLLPDETILHSGAIHWFVYVPGAVLLILGMFPAALLGAVAAADPNSDGVGWVAFAAIVPGTILVLRAWILKATTELAVTSKRLIGKTGFISRKTLEIGLGSFESLSVDQSIVGRMLNFGTVTLQGTGGAALTLKAIRAPLDFRTHALTATSK